MKLQILQENFEKAVNIASRFASTKAQLPILGNILLSAQKTKLVVSSTNLEVSVSTEVGAKITKDGDLCIPAKVIAELASNLPKETISLDSEKEQLKISTASFSSNVLGLDSSDFPKIPTLRAVGDAIALEKDALINGLSKVLFAASVDETRPVLTGVLFIFAKTGITLVATDGFRLSQKELKIKLDGEPFRIVVPKLILSELSRLGGSSQGLRFKHLGSEKQIIFADGEITLSSRLLEGEYPDFEKIIPSSSLIKVFIDREDLLRAVKLASIFAKEAANVIKLKVLKDNIKVFAESSSAGSQEMGVEVKVETSEKTPFEIAFNYRFLEDFLHATTGEEISMEFSGANAPGVFKETKDPDYLHLIMPVKIQG